jgi:hypothetical protein
LHNAVGFARIGVDHNGIDFFQWYFEFLNDLSYSPTIHVFQHNTLVVVIAWNIFP